MSKGLKRLIAGWTLVGVELLVLAFVAAVCVGIFLTMAKLVFIDHNNSLDATAFAFAESHTTPGFTRVMQFVTFFASKDFLIYGSLGLAAFFMFFKKHRWYSVKIPVISAGSSMLNQGMKTWFDRPRPTTAFVEQTGFSFPSGHAMIGGAFYGLLLYLVWVNFRPGWLRTTLMGLLILWILLIGYSRVYLHVHYASDVLAGWAAGFLFLIIGLMVLRKLEPKFARETEAAIQEESSHPGKG
jgi:membrane-associated phospholipid phosphatase